MDALTDAALRETTISENRSQFRCAPATHHPCPATRPVPIVTLTGLRAIVRHPAFRLGVLDAQSGAPFDAKDLLSRLNACSQPHTNPARFGKHPEASASTDRMLHHCGAISSNRRKRQDDIPNSGDAELAQTRYEEGRMAVLEHGLSCTSWTNPARPPASVRNFAVRLAVQFQAAQLQAARARRQTHAASSTPRTSAGHSGHSRHPVWPTLPL